VIHASVFAIRASRRLAGAFVLRGGGKTRQQELRSRLPLSYGGRCDVSETETFVRMADRPVELLGSLGRQRCDLTLIRAKPRRSAARAIMPFDTLLFHFERTRTRAAADSDRTVLLDMAPLTWNFLPAGTDVLEEDIQSGGETLFVKLHAASLVAATDGPATPMRTLVGVSDRTMTWLTNEMRAVLRRPDSGEPCQLLYLDGLTTALSARVAGHLHGGAPAKVASLSREDVRIARVLDYVDAHLGEPLSVAELAGVACLSPAQFSRAFKSTIGEAVWAYVQRRRCERARDLLRLTCLSLADVAYEVGFTSQSHFTTAMKRRYDATPGAIRAEG
jgi:AraC-like DNA-binding protein